MIIPKKTVCDVCGREIQKREGCYKFTKLHATMFKEYFYEQHMCLICFEKFKSWFKNNKTM